MTKALDLDLKKLQARAFDRAEWAGEALQRYHAAARKLDQAVVRPLRGLYQWMFVPTTLWPFNVQDVLEDCLTALEKGKRLNSRHRLLIDLLPDPSPMNLAGCTHANHPRQTQPILERVVCRWSQKNRWPGQDHRPCPQENQVSPVCGLPSRTLARIGA